MEKSPSGWESLDWESLNIDHLSRTLSKLRPDQQVTLTFQYGFYEELPVSISALLHRIFTDDEGNWLMEATPKTAYITLPESLNSGALFPGPLEIGTEGTLTEDNLIRALLGNDVGIECIQEPTRYALSKVIGAVVGVGLKRQ